MTLLRYDKIGHLFRFAQRKLCIHSNVDIFQRRKFRWEINEMK